MTMNVVVTKSPAVVVWPSEPVKTTSDTIELSSFDKGLVNRVATSLLVFEGPLHDAAETVKAALSQALVHYYPISGRIAAAGADDDDELHIRCTGEGVAFVAASANCALKEASRFFDGGRSPAAAGGAAGTTTLLDELVVFYPADCCGPTDPLLLVQATEFRCGGFVLGVTWSHGVADGTGMAQFVRAVGELARGSPFVAFAPARRDGALPSLPASAAALDQLVTSLAPLHLACHRVAIPWAFVRRVRGDGRQQSPCTVFETVAAVLWRSRTRAIAADPGSLALLSFPADVRRLVGAGDGYYGNCITQQVVAATSGAVAGAGIGDLVGMIRRAKEEIASQINENGGYDRLLQAIDDVEQIGQLQYNALNVSSWRNLGFHDADFGAGTPARVMCYGKPAQTLPLCVINPPCRGKNEQDGGDVFSVCVREEHVGAFLDELARFA